ncbi:MAG: ABC transporter permease [Caldicoprobacterales bacterium]
MNKNDLSGWKNVFTFTLVQTLKNKAYIITYIILIILALISIHVINMISSPDNTDTDEPIEINKVYVNNQTQLTGLDFNEIIDDERLSHIVFETLNEDYDALADRIENSEKDSAILNITHDEGMFRLEFLVSSGKKLSNEEWFQLSGTIADEFESFKNNPLGITEEQLRAVNSEIATEISVYDSEGNKVIEKDTSITYSEYWFIYGILFTVMMVNIMASTQIATSIVTEKSSRVIEFLLISIKPLALMIGKILAMLTAVLVQVVSLIIVVFLSNKLSSAFSSGNSGAGLSQLLPADIFNNLNPINILFCLLVVVLGMTFYAALAGLTGATVSRLEEMNEGLTLFTFVNMAGAYIGIGAANVLNGSGSEWLCHILNVISALFSFPASGCNSDRKGRPSSYCRGCCSSADIHHAPVPIRGKGL